MPSIKSKRISKKDLAYTYATPYHFVYYWLTRTEPLPSGERDIAHALGQKRLEYFDKQVRQKLGSGQHHGSNQLRSCTFVFNSFQAEGCCKLISMCLLDVFSIQYWSGLLVKTVIEMIDTDRKQFQFMQPSG